MEVTEFRDAVHAHFGTRLERATPATIRDFMARVRLNLDDGTDESLAGGEHRYTPEDVVREFFAHVFDFPTSTGFILLWIAAFEMWYSASEPDSPGAFARLIRQLD